MYGSLQKCVSRGAVPQAIARRRNGSSEHQQEKEEAEKKLNEEELAYPSLLVKRGRKVCLSQRPSHGYLISRIRLGGDEMRKIQVSAKRWPIVTLIVTVILRCRISLSAACCVNRVTVSPLPDPYECIAKLLRGSICPVYFFFSPQMQPAARIQPSSTPRRSRNLLYQ